MSLINDNDDQVIVDENADYLAELTKPGARFDRTKYQSEADLYKDMAKSKWHADKTLELSHKRMDELRQEYLKEREQNITRAQLEELIEKFAKQPLASNANPIVNEEKLPVFNPQDLEGLVASNYEKMREKERQDNNYKSVEDKARERYGANFRQKLAETMNDLGLTPAELESMARSNPKVFIKTFGLDAQPINNNNNFQAPPRSGTPFQPTSGNHKTWSYYETLKKTKPEEYFSQKTQNQMMNDYEALGDKFEDGNFSKTN
jgi:hypothetical protein